MAIDHYSPCPCGSGKKLKFCKCIDNVQDFERIIKLIEGEQPLAAVDRINQMLEKTPNAAWLLAMKGELTLGLQEFDTFRETADRFHRLKPDNPLGLVMKAVSSAISQEPAENIARYVLDGMSESRESMPALTLTAIKLLIDALAGSGRLSMAGYWSDIFAALNGDAPEQDSPRVDPSINLLAKTPAKLLEDKPNAALKERLAEVISLAKTFRYSQAETKLRAILRDYPDEPGPLSHLLRAQCALIDQSGAHKTALKLSQHLGVSTEDRAYFRALALEIEPGSKSLQCELLLKYCEVDGEQRIEEELTKLDNVESPTGPALEQVRGYYATVVGDEVPAKRVFSIFSESLKGDASERKVSSSVGTVVLYGKQTDRPSRVLLIANQFGDYERVTKQIEDILQLGDEIDFTVPIENVYTEFLQRPHALVGDEAGQLSQEERSERLKFDFLNMKIKLFDGRSPKEVADDERARGDLIGLLTHLEGEQSIVVPANAINEIYQELGLERPKTEVDPASDSMRLSSAIDMDRIEVEELNDKQLKGLLVRAMALGASRVFLRTALAVRKRDGLKDDTQLQIAAMSGLMNYLPGLDEKLEICDELETALVSAGSPVGRVVIQRMMMLQSAGRQDEAQASLQTAVQKYPSDPYLMSFLQYAMQARGGGSGGSTEDGLAMKMMQNAARPEAETDGGIVLPGQSPASQNDSGGESKLWLPGS